MSDDTLTVRDHSQPCEHPDKPTPGFEHWEPLVMHTGAYQNEQGEWWCGDYEGCPGGREIVLRKEPVWVSVKEFGDGDGIDEPNVDLPDYVWVEVDVK